MRTSVHTHSPGSRIPMHREFYAEHVGTGLKLVSRRVRKLRRSHAGDFDWVISSSIGLFRPAGVLLYGAYNIGNNIALVDCAANSCGVRSVSSHGVFPVF